MLLGPIKRQIIIVHEKTAPSNLPSINYIWIMLLRPNWQQVRELFSILSGALRLLHS